MTRPADRLPEFAIIGAVKGATTWVAHQLRSQPGIFLPQQEPHYFSTAFDRGIDWYANLFREAPAGARIGEKSADYLAHPWAAARLAALLPEARLVVQLRNPVDRAYSDYCMLFRRGTVDGDIRRHLSPGGPHPRFLEDGFYWRHLSRWLRHFPPGQLHILFYDDVLADAEAELAKVAAHLRLGAVTPVAPEVRRNDSQARMLPLHLRRAVAPLKPVVAPFRDTGWFQSLHGRLARPVAYPPMDAELRRRLGELYVPDVEALGRHVGRDLGGWVSSRPRVAA
jgi:hypothetical protein